MTPPEVWDQASALQRAGVSGVVVTITGARGSTPGSVGAKALISDAGLVAGNLGGGRVEAKAIDTAVALLAIDGPALARHTWNLQRDVGMTCGGEMEFLFEKIAAEPGWHILLFGAGHVSQAVVRVLTTLPCRVEVVDVRADWLAKIPNAGNVTRRVVENYEEGVRWLAPQSYLLSITKGHSFDRPVLRDALRKYPSLPFVGVIGSSSKKAVLQRELREDGLVDGVLDLIVCPLGLPIGGNDPAEIAISIVAQLLERRGP
ncbi:MAG: xanthine dehydrogenase accessory protein XdhC [Verrucomicrobiota bacterium]